VGYSAVAKTKSIPIESNPAGTTTFNVSTAASKLEPLDIAVQSAEPEARLLVLGEFRAGALLTLETLPVERITPLLRPNAPPTNVPAALLFPVNVDPATVSPFKALAFARVAALLVTTSPVTAPWACCIRPRTATSTQVDLLR